MSEADREAKRRMAKFSSSRAEARAVREVILAHPAFMDLLSERELHILEAWGERDLFLSEIAKEYEISPERVRQIRDQAIRKVTVALAVAP